MNKWSQKSCTDHLGNLPVETTPSPLQPMCASPLLTGAKLHPWLTAIPKTVSSTLPNFFSNTPETSQTEKQTLKRKPNHTLTGHMESVPILPGYRASALRRSTATPNILKIPRPPLARRAFPSQHRCLCSSFCGGFLPSNTHTGTRSPICSFAFCLHRKKPHSYLNIHQSSLISSPTKTC